MHRKQELHQIPARLEPAKLETGHSDEYPCVAALLAESKASGIIILGIGCRFCGGCCRESGTPGTNELGKASPFVHMKVVICNIRACRLHKHAGTKLHRLATEALRNGDTIGSLPAPAASTFQELLERLRAGGLEQTRRGDRMAWCLYEAMRDDERNLSETG